MVKRTGTTTLELQNLIADIKGLYKRNNVKLWKRIIYELEKSTRQRRAVNIYKINKYTRDNEIALIPGKVLSLGDLNRKITVAAYQFSQEAREKINKKGKAITIKELIKQYPDPKGKKIRIIG